MIAFSCPRCKAFLTKDDKQAGQKIPCPGCGQRLQIPEPSAHKTALGEIVPPSKTILAQSEPAPGGVPPPIEAPLVEPVASPPPSGRTSVAVPHLVPIGECPSCMRSLSVPADQVRRWVTCPYCGIGFVALDQGRRSEVPAAPRPFARALNQPCPHCGSTTAPYHTSQMSQAGLIVMILLLLFFFPLFWIGLLMKDEFWVCPDCGHRSGIRTTGPF